MSRLGSGRTARPLVAPTHATLKVKRLQLNVLEGERASVAGALAPALADVPIALQGLTRHGGWRTLAETHTGAQGRYRLRYTPRRGAGEEVRVYFAGEVSGERRAPQGWAPGRVPSGRGFVVWRGRYAGLRRPAHQFHAGWRTRAIRN